MKKKYTYKKQGDGRDSWRVEIFENEVLIECYMVYDEPLDLDEWIG